MPPATTNHPHRAPLPASRVWLLTAAGASVLGGIGAFLSNGGGHRSDFLWQKPQHPPHSSHALAARFSSRIGTSARSIPSASANADSNPESAWSEDDKERIRIWARSAPRAAADWAAVLPPGGNRRFVLETAALAWGDIDPASAAQWAKSLGDEAERTLALTDIAGEAVRSAPILAIEIACSLSDATRDDILPRAASEWAVQEPTAAATWARQIPGEALRATVLAGVATAWSEQDPAAAASLAVKELPPGRLQANTIVSIVQRWAQQSPADAAAWVSQFPEGILRDTAMASLPPDSSRKP
jgi:hypothetical protein